MLTVVVVVDDVSCTTLTLIPVAKTKHHCGGPFGTASEGEAHAQPKALALVWGRRRCPVVARVVHDSLPSGWWS